MRIIAQSRFAIFGYPVLFGLLLTVSASGADLKNLPPNTWVAIEPAAEQPAAEEEKGHWRNVGWNKLVYDPVGKRVLFYDRWHDKKHGGTTIYGNCLFSFDPATARLTPIKIDNWGRRSTPTGGYQTHALPENEKEPTPCPRHVYQAFDYAPELKAVFICNGANQTAWVGDRHAGHRATHDTWRLDVDRRTWSRIDSKEHPANRLEHGMAWCPPIRSLVYAGHEDIWLMPIDQGQWRRARTPLPRSHMGISVFYDAPRQRVLLVGGGAYGKWQTREGGFNTIYALDPKTETVTRLADCPTALCRGSLAHDTKRDLFVAIASLKGDQVQQPSGMFCYDPNKDAWRPIKPANTMPDQKSTFWMPLCYDSTHDCFIGMVGTTFYAFRYVP